MTERFIDVDVVDLDFYTETYTIPLQHLEVVFEEIKSDAPSFSLNGNIILKKEVSTVGWEEDSKTIGIQFTHEEEEQ